MINKDRIVPATAQDLLGIYLTCMNFALVTGGGTALEVIPAAEIGVFNADDFASGGMADEPIKELVLGDESAFGVYGVLDYDFKGITDDGEAIALTNADDHELIGDGCTLYIIALSSGTITIDNIATGEQWTASV